MAKSIKKKTIGTAPKVGGSNKTDSAPAITAPVFTAMAITTQAKPGKTGKKAAKAVSRHLSRTAHLPSDPSVLDRLWAVVLSRRDASPSTSHSARLLSRGITKVAQKFGEEAVEAVIEAVAGDHDALVAESADVLYHLLVLWVAAGIDAEDVWAELRRREGVSGIAEKAARSLPVALRPNTRKIP